MKFAIYRERKRPVNILRESVSDALTKVKTVEASVIEEAVLLFVKSQPDGWSEEVVEVHTSRNTADVWMRRYTPSGRYKGETHFLVWPQP